MTDTTLQRDTLTIPQLAYRLSISESQAYELAKEGQLPFPVMRVGTSVRVSVRAYQQWLETHDYKEAASG